MLSPVNSKLLKEVNHLVTCSGCGELIDVRDKYCRWCGWTYIFDNDVPPRPYAIASPTREGKQTPTHAATNGELCPRCHGGGRIDNPVRSGIGLVLARGIFHDDEAELNSVNDLIENQAVSHDVNRGY